MATRHLTIMFTDIQGFTARVSDSSRDDLNTLLEQHAHLLQPVFRHFGGTVVKEIGDAFLVRFDSSTNAVMCGVAVQEVLRQHNGTVAEQERLHVRVAINSGDVELLDGDILGEPVNIAARLEAIAEPGEVYFTEAVYLTMNRKEAPAASAGEHTFKGIPYPVKVFSVVQPDNSPLRQRVRAGVRLTPRGPVITGFRDRVDAGGNRRAVIAIAAVVIVAAVGAALFFGLRPSAGETALDEARAASDPASALDIAAGGLAEEPGHKGLRAFALEAADRRLEGLRQKSGREALAWLRTEMKRRSFLEPLRKRVPELEAEEAAESDKPFENCHKVARRYATSPSVPLAAARRLRKLREPALALRMYQLAYRRGHPPEDELFEWIAKLYGENVAGHVRPASQVATTYFKERWKKWTRETLETTDNPRLFDNLVGLVKDESWFDPYYRALAFCLTVYASNDLYARSLKTVLADKNPQRRAQAIALHEAVVKKSPEHRSGKRCAQALKQLK